jgi:carbon-monoxide dehydrogenase small subunit
LINGSAVNSCLLPVCEAEGTAVTTIEGLAGPDGKLSVIQQAFLDKGGSQCGFCIPGIVLAGVALLSENPDPSDADIRYALTGNLCRCTGYVHIVESIRAAAFEARRAVT